MHIKDKRIFKVIAIEKSFLVASQICPTFPFIDIAISVSRTASVTLQSVITGMLETSVIHYVS